MENNNEVQIFKQFDGPSGICYQVTFIFEDKCYTKKLCDFVITAYSLVNTFLANDFEFAMFPSVESLNAVMSQASFGKYTNIVKSIKAGVVESVGHYAYVRINTKKVRNEDD